MTLNHHTEEAEPRATHSGGRAPPSNPWQVGRKCLKRVFALLHFCQGCLRSRKVSRTASSYSAISGKKVKRRRRNWSKPPSQLTGSRVGLELFASQSAGASGDADDRPTPCASPPSVGTGTDPFHLSAAKEAPGSILAVVTPSKRVLVTVLGQAPTPLRGARRSRPLLPSSVPSSLQRVNDSSRT